MIEYKNLTDSIKYFELLEFNRIEVPWIVPESVDAITRDVSTTPIVTKEGNLIASGEQGFLYLMLKGNLPKGKYCTITPCFRDDSYDMLHCPSFMKTELIIVEPTIKERVNLFNNMIDSCVEFFSDFFLLSELRVTETGKNMADIEAYKGGSWYELWSYGIRTHSHMTWIYGTACAEPRLSRLSKEV